MNTKTVPSAALFAAVPTETLLDGKKVRQHSIDITGQTFSISSGVLRYAGIEDEWFEDLKDPQAAIADLLRCQPRPDIFTFWQRVPEEEPRYSYESVTESLAVLPISTYEHWWNKQVKGTTRNMVRKSQKAGVVVREATFDEEFVRGIVEIFNETPMRQGRRFWHYGKDELTVQQEFSRFLYRECLIGAYLGDELIGFVMLANAGRFGLLNQFISKLAHRDKATNNALIAKAVELCEQHHLGYLVYNDWKDSSLVDFKRHSGFQEMKLPRYFVPLTLTGRLAILSGVHRGWRTMLPTRLLPRLRRLRSLWNDYALRTRSK